MSYNLIKMTREWRAGRIDASEILATFNFGKLPLNDFILWMDRSRQEYNNPTAFRW